MTRTISREWIRAALVGGMLFGAVSGIEQSDLSFTEDSLHIASGSQWGSLSATTGVPTATFQISFARAAVPEPASLAGLGIGLAALASVRRRRKAAGAFRRRRQETGQDRGSSGAVRDRPRYSLKISAYRVLLTAFSPK